ncbi:hypothetical protein HMPREF1550_02307 [Actinomyces sp. oral taxon 877 str. F0543]|nr:hypothetical protein HMPREF1550_02307 [Actinomyces sp. oral taxon 877 str. F0543]
MLGASATATAMAAMDRSFVRGSRCTLFLTTRLSADGAGLGIAARGRAGTGADAVAGRGGGRAWAVLLRL